MSTVIVDPSVLAEIAAMQEGARAVLTSAALRAAVRTGVFDAMSLQPQAIGVVAERAGVDAGALRRVLRFLEPGGYVLVEGDAVTATERTRAYQRDSILWPSLAHLGSFDVAHALDYTLRTGRSAWEHVHSAPFFEWLAANPQQEQIFAESMRNEGTVLNLLAVPSIDLSGVALVADVGGGSGDLLSALLAANPHVKGILVDLPSVLEHASLDEERCTKHAADLFGPMPTADAYVLARVLHDWSDEDCVRILSGIRAAAARGARMFNLDLVMPAGRDAHVAKLSDIGMMLLFGGGRERTRDEFDELFASAGWRLDSIMDLPANSLLTATAI